MRTMTVQDIKAYEIKQFRKAFEIGTGEAWKKYTANVKRAVAKYNKAHADQIDYDVLTE